MKVIWKKVISCLLIITLVITAFPYNAFAKGEVAENTAAVETISHAGSWPEDMYGTADFEGETTETASVPVAEDERLRSESIKHFVNSDGTFTAVNYLVPVHYQEEGSLEWKEIDNTLQEVTREENGEEVITYVPADSPADVEIAGTLDEETHVSLKGNKYSISWTYEDVKAAKSEKKALKEAVKREKKEEKYKLKKKITDGLVFENMTKGTDLEVLVDGANLKENLILKNKHAQTEYVIRYKIGDLTAEQKDEHTIVFKDCDEEVYTISAPYMKDAAGTVSESVSLELLSQENGTVRAALRVDKKWLKDKERVYPITVDPYVMETTKNINYDASAIYKSGAVYPHGTLLVGNDNGSEYGKTKSYIKFSLPALQPGDMVTGGSLYLAQAPGSYGFSAVGDDELQINAYRLTSSWDADDIKDSSGYSGLPGRDTTIIDYENVSLVDEPDWINFDISKVVKGWYEDENNCGICLIADDQSQWALARFLATDCTDYENSSPFLTINYLNNKGLESRWTYHEQSLGESGTGYVNDYTGNLVFTVPLVETTGNNMPVSLSLIYNGYQKGTPINQVTTVGKGWRLNIQQCIIPISSSGTSLEKKLYEAGYRYIYEDADGTAHYFTKKEGSSTTYVDEEGLGLELKAITSDDNLEDYQIIADAGGRLTFTEDGLLRKVYDDNGNFYTIRYRNDIVGAIAYIEDGVGRAIYLDMDEDNRLISIEDPADRIIDLHYASSNFLSQITYPDNTTNAFTYNLSRLIRVKGRDFRRLQYSYPASGDTSTLNRVVKIEEFCNTDGGDYAEENLGNSLTISYTGKNRTRFEDHTGFKETYQFDNYGRTMSISDAGGSSATYKYVSGSNSSKKANRMTAAGSTSRHVNNLLRDHSFENSSGDWTLVNDGASLTTSTTWLGKKSLKITDDVGYAFQSYTVDSGTYTLSAYVTTENGSALPKLRATFFDADGDVIERKESEPISRKVTWERTRVTFTVPDGTEYFNVICKNEEQGTAWFDGVQLETGRSLNPYNLVENSNFADTSSSAWSGYNLNEADGDGYDTSQYYGRYYRIYGDGEIFKRRSQKIPINRKAEDVHFSVSGLGYADSVPLTGSRRFGLAVYTEFTDGTSSTSNIKFNPDYPGSWQYTSGTIGYSGDNASKTIDFISVRCVYYYNENCAGFDNIKVNFDETGTAYAYDDNGNLTSAIDNANRKETFTYNESNDLKKAVSSDNKEYTYTYSDTYKHRLASATSKSSDLKFTFGYDDYGNVIAQRVRPVDEEGNVTGKYIRYYTGYTDDGNYVAYENDDRGYSTSYTYDEEKGLLTNVEDRKGNETAYTYNSNNDDLLRVTSGNSSVAYTYDVYDHLTKITSPSTSYSFTYDAFGNVLKTKAGDNTLNTNTYEENNGNLISSTYGNGFKKSYTYDDYDRVTSEAYDGNTRFYWSYNADGQVGRHYDEFLDKNYYYTYDLAGRPIRTDISDGSCIRAAYNDVNLNTDVHYKIAGVGGRDVYYNYSSKDNLPLRVKFGSDSKCQVTNGYDDLTRLTSKTYASLNDGVSNIKAEYGYLDWTSADYPDRTTGLVNSINYTYTSGDIAVSDRFYVYDRNGNITEERKGTTSSGSLREKYTYDALNRLTRHDSALQNKSYTYSYDNAGNLLKKRTYAYTTGTLGEVQDTVTYQYSSSGWKDRLISYDGTSITYDAIGNMKTFGDKSFTWQGRNLKTFAEGSDQASYVYNADGIRTKKTVNGTTTEYFLNGDQIIAQTTDGDTIWFFYDSEGNRVGLIKNGACYYYLYNIQGDVIGLVRATTGKLAATYKYDAWGNCKVINAEGHTIGDVNPFRYRGYYYDAENGLYYLNSRYDNPEVGRFISADGQINSDILGANLYAYCSDNPVSRIDNQGTFWDVVLDVTFTAYSAWQVLKDPKNPANWAALGADLVCLVVPVVTGGGAAVRAASKADDVIDAGKVINRADSIADAGGAASKGKGFDSYKQLKRYIGPAGVGNEWHHIVEQNQISKSGFSVQAIQNTNNIISIDKNTHRAISGYYSSIQPFTQGKTVRNWLVGQSFDMQYQFGVDVIKLFM